MNCLTVPKKKGESLIVSKKWKGGPFCFGMAFYLMLEACVENEVLSTYGKSALMHKSGPIALNWRKKLATVRVGIFYENAD